MSILNSIKEYEAKAEKLRLEATNEVKALLEATRVLTNERINSLYAQAEKDKKLQLAATKSKIAAKEKELDVLHQESDKQMIKHADGLIDEAVDFILKKVETL